MPPAGGPSFPAMRGSRRVCNGPYPRTVLTARGHVQTGCTRYGIVAGAELLLALALAPGVSDVLGLALGDSELLGLALPAAPAVGVALALGDSDALGDSEA